MIPPKNRLFTLHIIAHHYPINPHWAIVYGSHNCWVEVTSWVKELHPCPRRWCADVDWWVDLWIRFTDICSIYNCIHMKSYIILYTIYSHIYIYICIHVYCVYIYIYIYCIYTYTVCIYLYTVQIYIYNVYAYIYIVCTNKYVTCWFIHSMHTYGYGPVKI